MKYLSLVYTIQSLKLIVEDLRINGTDKEFLYFKKLLEELRTQQFIEYGN